MGWNSWNYFHCDINEEIVKSMADAMASKGMKEAGYEYIVIDDCWQIARDENGKIIADEERFPSGMKALADYVHSKGLKFGLYSDAGTKTCQKRPGGWAHEAIDARTYQEWGIDYLKYDWCATGTKRSPKTYPIMGKELAKLDHDIVFSICNWGRTKPWKWAGEWGHLWRTTGDIVPCYDCVTFAFFVNVLEIIDRQAKLHEYAGPGGWNDPDMLQVGNGDLTEAENRSHFALWCMMAAPLMAGNNLANMKPEVLKILTNKGAIAINQDPLGKQAYRAIDKGKEEVWVKPISNGEFAVCFLNRSAKSDWQVSFDWGELGFPDKFQIQDAWNDKPLGSTSNLLKATIRVHDVLLLRLSHKSE